MLRFAPSPTGDMHITSLRVAIINYLVAQQQKKEFLVRIDDTDKANVIEGKDTEIMQILEKFALNHESVFHQSEHLHIHQTMAIKLLEQDKAFVCTCSEEEIAKEKKKAKENNVNYYYSGKCISKEKSEHLSLKESGTPFVLRLKKPKHDISYSDVIQDNFTATPDEIDAFVILNADGTPSYNFACACADMLTGISVLITEDIRCLDTARQQHIKEQIGYTTDIDYAHIPALKNTKGDDSMLVKWFFEQGFIPDAIINYLILLSNPNAPKKIFTLPEAISWFKLENTPASSTHFDIDKLRLINRKHLERMDNKKLSSLFGFADEEVGKLVKLYLEEASTINELALKIRPIFAPKVGKDIYKKEMEMLKEIIADAPMINSFNDFKNHIIKESGLKEERIIIPLRVLLTGVERGPELADIYPLIKSYLLEIAS